MNSVTKAHKEPTNNEKGLRAKEIKKTQEEQLFTILGYYQDNQLEEIVLEHNGKDFLIKILKAINELKNTNPFIQLLLDEAKSIIEKGESFNKTINGKKLFDFAKKVFDTMRRYTDNQRLIGEILTSHSKITRFIDPKTKQLTKYGFDKELTTQFDKVQKGERRSQTVIIFDQNNLKDINESYGHESGQQSILEVGKIIEQEFRKRFEEKKQKRKNLGETEVTSKNYAISNYYGGDEWFISVNDISQKEIEKIINNIFNQFKKYNESTHLKLYGCFGIAYFKPKKEKGFGDVQIDITEGNNAYGLGISNLLVDNFLEQAKPIDSTQQDIDNYQEKIEAKDLLRLADYLCLEAKKYKSKKTGNSKKFLKMDKDNPNIDPKLYQRKKSKIKKLSKERILKMTIGEIDNQRKKLAEQLLTVRTIFDKKILNENLELVRDIYKEKRQKTIDSATNSLKELTISNSKQNTIIEEIIQKIQDIYKSILSIFNSRNNNKKIKKEYEKGNMEIKLLQTDEINKSNIINIIKILEIQRELFLISKDRTEQIILIKNIRLLEKTFRKKIDQSLENITIKLDELKNSNSQQDNLITKIEIEISQLKGLTKNIN